jgi:hypothetical protein
MSDQVGLLVVLAMALRKNWQLFFPFPQKDLGAVKIGEEYDLDLVVRHGKPPSYLEGIPLVSQTLLPRS